MKPSSVLNAKDRNEMSQNAFTVPLHCGWKTKLTQITGLMCSTWVVCPCPDVVSRSSAPLVFHVAVHCPIVTITVFAILSTRSLPFTSACPRSVSSPMTAVFWCSAHCVAVRTTMRSASHFACTTVHDVSKAVPRAWMKRCLFSLLTRNCSLKYHV